ncbi:hypothetical protein [Halovivax sp.]|uniref:hypothetical protein n=1 Tax=Halovivax sp. TaxID=1935978 RepID=UPI0025B9C171|nr:hypothetical protein [Halovivax sp.]
MIFTRTNALECARCDTTFDLTNAHTELVRRDFAGSPRSPKLEHLCEECWRIYVEDFLGGEFELLVE